jgi:hypothetical protein
MVEFQSRNEMILWLIDNFFYGYMYKFSEMANMSDNRLKKEIEKMTKGKMNMFKKNSVYFLEYLL